MSGAPGQVESASAAPAAPAVAAPVDAALGAPAAVAPTVSPPQDLGPARAWAYRVEPVMLLGRSWPRAPRFERLFWGMGALAGAVVLALAVWLQPDARGIGTHEQLGLPPCGFVQVFAKVPCPSCGFTTTFALAADGRLLDAWKNQPFGFVIFLATLVAVPAFAIAAVRGVSIFEATERWPWKRLVLGFIALWLLGWVYKWKVVMA